ncbi:hypothetical protein EMCRGX_G010290 [Ephydatia muelleri]
MTILTENPKGEQISQPRSPTCIGLLLRTVLLLAVCRRTSKTVSEEKDKRIRQAVKGEHSCVTASFRHWVNRTKKFELLNCSELELTDVLCHPVKAKNENDKTIFGHYRVVAMVEKFYDILERIHSLESGHVDYKKTLAEIDLIDMRHMPDGSYHYWHIFDAVKEEIWPSPYTVGHPSIMVDFFLYSHEATDPVLKFCISQYYTVTDRNKEK